MPPQHSVKPYPWIILAQRHIRKYSWTSRVIGALPQNATRTLPPKAALIFLNISASIKGVSNPLFVQFFLYLIQALKNFSNDLPFLFIFSWIPLYSLSRIVGTAIITVGFSIEISPFCPLIILLLVSVNVWGDEYPIGMPNDKNMNSRQSSKMWARGKYPTK